MRRGRSVLLAGVLVAAGFLMLTVRADAHHSQAPFFDGNQIVEIQGVVTKWAFRNPHPLLYVEVTDENGQKVEWLCQFANTNRMRRMGVTAETFPAGMKITVSGNPSRVPGTYGMNPQLVIMPDGQEIRGAATG